VRVVLHGSASVAVRLGAFRVLLVLQVFLVAHLGLDNSTHVLRLPC
jgi:hypothetical protein